MAKFTESFDQPDSTTLGPDLTWTEVAGDWETIGGQAGMDQVGVNAYVRAEGDTGSADMYVEAVLPVESVFSANYTDHQILARMDATAHTGYALLRGYGAVEGQFVLLRRYQAGSVTELTARITLPADLPETMRLEVEGSTITAYRNGVQVASVTDSVITTGGYGGLGGYRSTTSANQEIRFDTFEAGALGETPVPAYPGMVYRKVGGALVEQEFTLTV